MMHISRFVFLIGLILIVRCEETILAKLCGKNEIFTCGLPCIETCDYKPEFCTKNCLFDCFCKEGYVRQSNLTGSPCIKRLQCQSNETEPTCCRNQEYSNCGSPCSSTCNDFTYPIGNSTRICPAVCVSGCFCKKGYYRSSSGSCVLPTNCCTGENEEYKACGTACPPTCQTPNPTCTKQCIQGCFCKQGYIRSTNGQCVKLNQCCNRQNEIYQECGTACQETCSYKPEVCIELCVPGCFCKSSDYVRQTNSTTSSCISRKQCF